MKNSVTVLGVFEKKLHGGSRETETSTFLRCVSEKVLVKFGYISWFGLCFFGVKLSLETEETEDFGATRVNTCEVCSREGHGLQTCALCFCMFHPVCCKSFLEYAAGVDFASLVKEIQHSICLPNCFFVEAMLCSMCAGTYVVDIMDV